MLVQEPKPSDPIQVWLPVLQGSPYFIIAIVAINRLVIVVTRRNARSTVQQTT